MLATAALLLAQAPGAAAAPVTSGQQIFAQNCAACHQPAGQGIPGAFPALARNKFVTGDPAKVAQLLLNGRGGMPTFRDGLDDAQIAAVASFVRSSWGNRAPPVPVALVAKWRGGAEKAIDRPMPGH
jgi:mono/diheme cytochrome c family protein